MINLFLNFCQKIYIFKKNHINLKYNFLTSIAYFSTFQKNDVIITDHPATNNESKNICPNFHCDFGCKIVKDENDCSVCDCQTFEQPTTDSTVAIDDAGKKICPEVKCDLHCERGLVMDENDCTFCKCRTPESTSCPPLIGCRKRCAFGYKTNKRGCSVSTDTVSSVL